MKLIDQMTHDEIVALKREDIERMIVYICATEGIKLLPQPVKPEKPAVEPDLIAYCLDDFYSFNRDVLNEIAVVFAKHRAAILKENYNWSVGSENKRLVHDQYPVDKMTDVKLVKVFSDKLFAEFEGRLRLHKEAVEAYNADLKEYEAAKKQREDATDWVWAKYNESMDVERTFSKLMSAYNEYVTIAGGDTDMAMTFLKKAYLVTEQQELRLKARI